jgi:hypothetical protein
MEHTGCGHRTISTGWGIGGGELVYDEVSHKLVGASVFSDEGFGACGASAYTAGDTSPCNEGTVCSLCDPSGASCAPACSIQVLMSNGYELEKYDQLIGPDQLYDCQGPDSGPRPELHRGCGRVTLVTSFGSHAFAADTHEPLAVSIAGEESCNGQWGTAGAPCTDEMVCSMCSGDPNVCQF